jgi:hypothetical protein
VELSVSFTRVGGVTLPTLTRVTSGHLHLLPTTAQEGESGVSQLIL